jgi:D-alanyl-D-alanine carboxypeptidase (penicillin-binding protein 5/6)
MRQGSARLPAALLAGVVLSLLVLLVPWIGPTSPHLVLRSSLATAGVVPGRLAPLPWPASGQAALSIPEVGVAVRSGAEHPAPVASLTKIMTAYLVLRDHPLAAGGNGPSLVMGAADVADFEQDTVTDQESAEVTLGEVLTERQLLTGMLVHSADNFADTLARWDAGSVPAFVQRMNAAAQALGMRQTHFADTSGFDPGSVSTPADILKVAAAAMRFPAFEQMVQLPSVTLPVAGTLPSYTPLLGVPGVVGVKSGFTSAAGGGDVLAWRQPVAGRLVTVLAAVTGQEGPDVLGRAGLLALSIARAAGAQLEPLTVVDGGERVALVSAAGRRTAVAVARPLTLVAWPGEPVHWWLRLPPGGLRAGSRAGTCLGVVSVALGAQRLEEPACTTGALPGPVPAHGLL